MPMRHHTDRIGKDSLDTYTQPSEMECNPSIINFKAESCCIDYLKQPTFRGIGSWLWTSLSTDRIKKTTSATTTHFVSEGTAKAVLSMQNQKISRQHFQARFSIFTLLRPRLDYLVCYDDRNLGGVSQAGGGKCEGTRGAQAGNSLK